MHKGDGQHVHVDATITMPDGTVHHYATFLDPGWDQGRWHLAGPLPVTVTARTGLPD